MGGESHLQLGIGDCLDSSHMVKKKKSKRNFETASRVVNVYCSKVAVAAEGWAEAAKQKKKVKKKENLEPNVGESQCGKVKSKNKRRNNIEGDNASIGHAAGEQAEQLPLDNNLLSENFLKPAKEMKKKKRKHKEIGGNSSIYSVPSYEETNGGTQIATGENGYVKEGYACAENQGGYNRNNKKRKKWNREDDCVSQLEKTIDAGDGSTEADKKTDKEKRKNEFGKNGLNDISKDITTKETHKKVSFSNHLEVFPLPDKIRSGNNHSGRLVRGKRFTAEEDEIVKEAVVRYIDEHQLGEEGLYMVLNNRSYRGRGLRGCWKDIAASIPWRPRRSVYFRAHILFEQGFTGSWSPEEIDVIRKFLEKHGPKWKELGKRMGRHMRHVRDIWRAHGKKSIIKGRWTQEEHQNLFDLVNKDLRLKVFEEKKSRYGMLRDNISWEAIGDKLPTRSAFRCRQKWYGQLTSPMVVEGSWTDSDDYRLIQALVDLDACCIEDVDWDNVLEHRSADLCLKRWNQMSRHLGAYRTKSFAEQVEILSKRYCPEMAEVREIIDSRPIVDADDGSQ